MNRTSTLAASLLCFALSSCMLPGGREFTLAARQQAARQQTMAVLLTQTAMPGDWSTHTPAPLPRESATVTLPAAFTPTGRPPTATRAALFPRTPTAMPIPCDAAQAGRPIDVTIPDGTRMKPGEYFSKTWRLVNVGSCAWDSRYALVWFSGADLGVSHSQSLPGVVMPGKSADLTVEMIAPLTPGIYQSNWKLRNSQGVLFGIGPRANAPFWVRIEVVPEDTPTPLPATATPIPLPTATPVWVAGGVVVLSPALGVDFDSGATGAGDGIDLLLDWPEDQPGGLVPQNGALWLPVDSGQSGAGQCGTAPVQEKDAHAPLLLDQVQAGGRLCLRSEQGQTVLLMIAMIAPGEHQVTVEFTTWKGP